jgi:hypothetical protein
VTRYVAAVAVLTLVYALALGSFQPWDLLFGTGLSAALLFAALRIGTSTRNLNPDVFPPELAGNLTELIQGLVVIFVGAELLILSVWAARKRLKVPGRGRIEP